MNLGLSASHLTCRAGAGSQGLDEIIGSGPGAFVGEDHRQEGTSKPSQPRGLGQAGGKSDLCFSQCLCLSLPGLSFSFFIFSPSLSLLLTLSLSPFAAPPPQLLW